MYFTASNTSSFNLSRKRRCWICVLNLCVITSKVLIWDKISLNILFINMTFNASQNCVTESAGTIKLKMLIIK